MEIKTNTDEFKSLIDDVETYTGYKLESEEEFYGILKELLGGC